MKTIHINRHAKSSWKNHSLRDFDRPLNKRGKINAAFMSEKFAKEKQVDLIISSPANRAKTTALYFATALGIEEDSIAWNKNIYGASVAEMMQILNSVQNSADSIILFGHNPTFTELAWYLDHTFNSHIVTCARVQIEFDLEDWSLIGKDSGRVIEHHYPRMHSEMENL